MQELHVHVRCMNCEETWDREFLNNNFPKVFISREYRNHLRSLYFEQEMSTITECVPYVESENRLNEYNNELINNYITIRNLTQRNKDIKRNISNEKLFLDGFINNSNESGESARIIIKGRCPTKECNGFVTDKWACSTCNIKVCHSCMEPKEENHECNPHIRDSIAFIRNDTKPCPSCGVRVHRIEGCYQMWCTSCHTAFDWTRGTVIKDTQHFHNPHYTEYVRDNRHTIENIYSRIRNCTYFNHNTRNSLTEIARNLNHIIDIIERQNLDRLFNKRIRKMKIKYLRNEIDRENLRLKIEREYTLHSYRKQNNDVVYQYCNRIRELLEEYIRNASHHGNSDNYNALIIETGMPYFEKIKSVHSMFGKDKKLANIENMDQFINPRIGIRYV